jgi:hypothetical protein
MVVDVLVEDTGQEVRKGDGSNLGRVRVGGELGHPMRDLRTKVRRRSERIGLDVVHKQGEEAKVIATWHATLLFSNYNYNYNIYYY